MQAAQTVQPGAHRRTHRLDNGPDPGGAWVQAVILHQVGVTFARRVFPCDGGQQVGIQPRHAAAQDIIYDYLSREGVKLLHEEGDRAFYRPSTDEVVLPIRKQFISATSVQLKQAVRSELEQLVRRAAA